MAPSYPRDDVFKRADSSAIKKRPQRGRCLGRCWLIDFLAECSAHSRKREREKERAQLTRLISQYSRSDVTSTSKQLFFFYFSFLRIDINRTIAKQLCLAMHPADYIPDRANAGKQVRCTVESESDRF